MSAWADDNKDRDKSSSVSLSYQDSNVSFTIDVHDKSLVDCVRVTDKYLEKLSITKKDNGGNVYHG